jgi:threonine/homoserine/homoserine lactone efflux protein
MHKFLARINTRTSLIVGSLVAFVTVAVPGMASAAVDTTAVSNGTAGLQTGVDTLTAFLYAALPILLALAVAAAIVRWVYRRVTSGAH